MKKTIIVVSSIVLLLGVNFASAMKVLPPLAIAEPLNSFEQQIWSDIQILQNQISNLAQRVATVEQKPVRPVLHLYDYNNQNLGIVVSALDGLGQNFVTYLPDEKLTLTFQQSFGGVTTGHWVSTIYFSQINCQGTPFEGTPGYPIGAVISSNRLFKFTNNPISTIGTESILESGICRNQPAVPGLYQLEEVPMPFSLPITGPLEIRAE